MSKFRVSSFRFQVSGFKFPFRRTSGAASGFTILELLVVISIMAVIATLATGAAIKAVKQGRVRKIEATCKALEMALVNYRAQEGKWPFRVSELEQPDRNVEEYWAHGKDNKKVFKNVYHGPRSPNQTAFLDGSALLALYEGGRAQLRAVLTKTTDVPLIYPDPDNTSVTRFYCVEYNPVTDKVTVHTQKDHTCPEWVKEKK